MKRREFLKHASLAAAAGLLAGCAGDKLGWFHQRGGSGHAAGGGQGAPLASTAPAWAGPIPPPTLVRAGGGRTAFPGPCPRVLAAEARDSWGAGAPIGSRLRAMGAVEMVTIHHEGSPHANYDVTRAQVARTLRRVQAEHRRRMHAGDIGYHYIVDRAGRVWQGRDSRFQGAHVSRHNPHNLGIMALGNFELQSPTAAQLASLATLCHMLLHGYRIPASRLFMHRELGNTRCPGRRLIPRVVALREHLARV